jgi:hypothetical protein
VRAASAATRVNSAPLREPTTAESGSGSQIYLVGVGEPLGEEPAAVLGGEHAGVAPALAGQRSRVLLRDRPDIGMSTISRSPGLAPCTVLGPLSTCTLGSGASSTSSAESSLWMGSSPCCRSRPRSHDAPARASALRRPAPPRCYKPDMAPETLPFRRAGSRRSRPRRNATGHGQRRRLPIKLIHVRYHQTHQGISDTPELPTIYQVPDAPMMRKHSHNDEVVYKPCVLQCTCASPGTVTGTPSP